MLTGNSFPFCRLSLCGLLSVFCFTGPTRPDDLDDKLLQAELHEVSAGDLTKAVEAYKSIQADDKAPARLRARALLNLGRCQRKLGELDGAKRSLEDLVKLFPEEREAVRQAQGFLRELSSGKAENPQFDWLAQLEKSPEIQARVFDLCMDLAGTDDAKLGTARRQLLALGSVAVPVMERVFEVSRDGGHRQKLALAMVQCGRYERLESFLDPENPPDWKYGSDYLTYFVASIPRLPEASRQSLLEALSQKTDPRLARDLALLRLLAGDQSELEAKLEAIAPSQEVLKQNQRVVPIWRSLLRRVVKSEASAAQFLAARIVEADCPERLRSEYVDALREAAPATLTPQILARSLRAGKEVTALSRLAAEETEAVPELVDLLRHRADEVPKFRPDVWDGKINTAGLLNDPARTSDPYLAGMASLLDSPDLVTLAIALEPLASAPNKLDSKVVDQVEKLSKESTDPDLREFALVVLVNNVQHDRDTATRAAAAVFAEFLRRQTTAAAPAAAKASPLAEIRHWFQGQRQGTAPAIKPKIGLPVITMPDFAWIHQVLMNIHFLYESALPLCDSAEGARFHALLRIWNVVDAPTLEAFLPKVQSDELSVDIAANLVTPKPNKETLPKGTLNFLERVARNQRLPIALRLAACYWAPTELYPRWDWAKLLVDDPELADGLLRGRFFENEQDSNRGAYRDYFWYWFRAQSEEAQSKLFAIGMANPHEGIRGSFAMQYPSEGPSAIETFRKLLQDPSSQVRRSAITRLRVTTRADFAPLYLDMLGLPDAHARTEAIKRLPEFASIDSLEPLTKLLDDPDIAVRNQALEALKKIKATLAERDEWKRLVESLKLPKETVK